MADISRSELSTLIEEAYASTLLNSAAMASAALSSFRRVDMGTKVTNLPVLATLPEADFVAESATESDGVKPTSQVTWGNKQLVAEEIAVIIPVHENAVDDATEDVIEQIAVEGGAAIGRKLDGAVFFGTDKPASWTSDSLFDAADGASQTHGVGDAADGEDLTGCIFKSAEDVDTAGWEPTHIAAKKGMRYRLANQRNADGTPIFLPSLSTVPGSVDTIAGLTAAWVSGIVWDSDEAEAIVYDANRVLLGVRQDISVKFLDQATVGSINLAERDMVALRLKARFAYVLGSGANSAGTAKVPAAAVVPAGS